MKKKTAKRIVDAFTASLLTKLAEVVSPLREEVDELSRANEQRIDSVTKLLAERFRLAEEDARAETNRVDDEIASLRRELATDRTIAGSARAELERRISYLEPAPAEEG